MKINSIKLINFRSHKMSDFCFLNGLNVLKGANATGKTTVVEAVYLLGIGRSPRSADEKNLIKEDQNSFFVEGAFESSTNNKYVVSYGFDGSKKVIKKNKMLVKKISSYIGTIDVIWFSAFDLNLLSGIPQNRRSNFDRIMCQISKVYYTALSNYKKILKERNALLKRLIFENKKTDQLLLETIDQSICKEARILINIRRKTITKFNELLAKKTNEVEGISEILNIKYTPNVSEENIEDALKQSLNDDLKRGTTGVGPHKDDYIFIINNKNIAAYGSQGQQRNAIINLKLAEVELIYEVKNEYPILILDDVFSELDKKRQNTMLKSVNEEVQTIITTTSIDDIDECILKKSNIIAMKGDN